MICVFVCFVFVFFFMLKLLQYCNYIIIVMQIKLMLLLVLVVLRCARFARGSSAITHASAGGDYFLFEKMVRGVGVRLFVVGYYLKYFPHRGVITRARRFIEERLLFEEMLHHLCPCWHYVHGVILIRIPKLY